VSLPRRDLALATLTRRGRSVQTLTNGLVDRLDVETEQGADACGSRRPNVGNVVDLVLVQADRAHEIHLNLVSGRDPAHQGATVLAGVLSDREDRRDVVARVRVFGREESVVVVELAHGHAVGPRCPLGARTAVKRRTEQVRASAAG
jgi:hypothetical protein